MRVGLWREFHANGGISEEGRYTDGNKAGYWVEWNDSGQIVARGEYSDGRRSGVWSVMNDDGSYRPVDYDNRKPPRKMISFGF